jgi:hypothetical protein
MKRILFHCGVRKLAPVLLALAAVLSAAHTVSACPTCGEAMAANDPENNHMVKGYTYSILFMMGMPYTVFMCFAGYMYWEVKKARARNAAAAPGASAISDPTKPLAPATAVTAAEMSTTAEPSQPQSVPPDFSLQQSSPRELSPSEPAESQELVEA